MSAARTLGATVAALAVVIAGGALVSLSPAQSAVDADLEVHAGLGTMASGRTSTVIVHDVALAESIDLPNGDGNITTGGVWVVVDASVADGNRASDGYVHGNPTTETLLRIGDRTWSVYKTVSGVSLSLGAYGTGIPSRGQYLFEVPADIADDPGANDAQLVVRSVDDLGVDSVPVIHFDLTAADHSRRVDIYDAYLDTETGATTR